MSEDWVLRTEEWGLRLASHLPPLRTKTGKLKKTICQTLESPVHLVMWLSKMLYSFYWQLFESIEHENAAKENQHQFIFAQPFHVVIGSFSKFGCADWRKRSILHNVWLSKYFSKCYAVPLFTPIFSLSFHFFPTLVWGGRAVVCNRVRWLEEMKGAAGLPNDPRTASWTHSWVSCRCWWKPKFYAKTIKYQNWKFLYIC